jgi:hypothetical protein
MRKIKERIRIDKHIEINLIYKKENNSKPVINLVKKGVRQAYNFFSNSTKLNFTIELVYSRNEFDKLFNKKTENWVIGCSFKNRFIIFSPELIEKFTSHKKNEFLPIIVHETTHIIMNQLNTKFSYWLSEGLAQNIAKQKNTTKFNTACIEHFIAKNLFKNSSYDAFVSNQGYEISYVLVKYLLKKYGKGTLLNLYKIDFRHSKLNTVKYVEQILGKNKFEIISEVRKLLN